MKKIASKGFSVAVLSINVICWNIRKRLIVMHMPPLYLLKTFRACDVKSLISIVNTIIRLDTKQQKQTQKTAHFSSDILELKKLKTDTAHFALFNKTACSQRREMKPKLNASRKITILSILNSSTQFIYNTCIH